MEESVDPDELMDLEEAEGSDLDEDDEESIDDPLPSPFQFPSGPASATTSAASSPLTNEDIPAPYSFSGKPLNLKRGRGRPRREGGKFSYKKK